MFPRLRKLLGLEPFAFAFRSYSESKVAWAVVETYRRWPFNTDYVGPFVHSWDAGVFCDHMNSLQSGKLPLYHPERFPKEEKP